MYGHTGAQIAELLLKFPSEQGIPIERCRAQSYDNASDMSGKYNGVQAIIRSRCPNADYVPCTAHSLNLVGKHAAQACSAGVAMFNFIQNVYNFFSASTHRWAVLKKHLEGLPVDKSLSETRWSARGDAVKALNSCYKENAKALEEIAADPEQSAETRNEASGLLQRLETAILLELWNDILQQFQKTSCSLQKAGLPLNCALNLLDSLLKFVEPQAARKLVQAYPDDLEDTFPNELVQFVHYFFEPLQPGAKVRKMRMEQDEDDKRSIEFIMFLDLKKNELSETFTNVEIALRIYLCMMVSNCTGERSFSKLKRLKSYLRSTMGQKRLTALSIKNIEWEILRSLDFSKLVNDFAAAKARKLPFT